MLDPIEMIARIDTVMVLVTVRVTARVTARAIRRRATALDMVPDTVLVTTAEFNAEPSTIADWYIMAKVATYPKRKMTFSATATATAIDAEWMVANHCNVKKKSKAMRWV